jgi:hypothetical protein
MAALKQAFDETHSDSLLPLLFLLLVNLIGPFRLYRTRFRLNGGFGAGFRGNTFGFSAPSPFLSLYQSLLLALLLCRFHFRQLLFLCAAFTSD